MGRVWWGQIQGSTSWSRWMWRLPSIPYWVNDNGHGWGQWSNDVQKQFWVDKQWNWYTLVCCLNVEKQCNAWIGTFVHAAINQIKYGVCSGRFFREQWQWFCSFLFWIQKSHLTILFVRREKRYFNIVWHFNIVWDYVLCLTFTGFWWRFFF